MQYADAKPPPKDDYLSLILIVAATALKPFPTLLDTPGFETKQYVKGSFDQYLGAGTSLNENIFKAFSELTEGDGEFSLKVLQQKWENEGSDVNRDWMCVMPKEVHIMAGY